MISGFLLYRPFAADHFGGRPAPERRTFWIRRLKRIVPAYWAAFLIITYVLHADTVRHAWYSPLVYLGFAQIYSPHYILSGLGQAWSLCIEMSFYLLLPLYATRLTRKHRSPDGQLQAELAGIAALVAISLVFRFLVLSFHGPYASTMPNWLPGYLDQFAFGMVLAVISAWLAADGRRGAWLGHPAVPWASWAFAAATFFAVSNIGLAWTPIAAQTVATNLERQTLYGLFAFFVVLPAVFGPQDRSPIRRLLQVRPLVLIGVVSYGVYLWHEAWMYEFFSWTGDHIFSVPLWELTGAVTAAAIVSASLSYVIVERPFLRARSARRVRVLPKRSVREVAPNPTRTAAADVTAAGASS